MKLRDTEKLYVCSMGKLLRVTAIFTDDNHANKYMETHNEGVVACFAGLTFLANMYDSGHSDQWPESLDYPK